MAGIDALFIAEWIVIPLLLAVISAFWKLKAELQGAREDTKVELAARQKMWDEAMIRIDHNFTELLSDHKDIKMKLDRLNEDVAGEIKGIKEDHSAHDRKMEAVYEITRNIQDQVNRRT